MKGEPEEMGSWDEVQFANLSPEEIATIKSLEKKLGDDISLVAVKSTAVLYVLEAKLAPNQWLRVDRVYPQIEQLKAYYSDYNHAKEAKAALKRFLINNKLSANIVKRPIRIRQVVDTEAGRQ